jgi:hypothetical protein
MPDLPKKKVGIVSCSGEELAEGTVTRLAALKVLEQLRPADTVTICLPLFLAGGEGDRAFAKFYPTIAIDGCEKRCAARGTEMYSAKPAASIVVTDLIAENGLGKVDGKRRLNEAGRHAVEATAAKTAEWVDDLLQKRWNRTAGAMENMGLPVVQESVQATCSCGSGTPVQDVYINGKKVTLCALPLIFQQLREAGNPASIDSEKELLDTVKVYNSIPGDEEKVFAAVLLQEYAAFCTKEGTTK